VKKKKTLYENRTKQILNIGTLSCRQHDVLFYLLILAYKKDRVFDVVTRKNVLTIFQREGDLFSRKRFPHHPFSSFILGFI